MINYSALDPVSLDYSLLFVNSKCLNLNYIWALLLFLQMEAHRMLVEERQQWQVKEEMMRDHMHQHWHWTQNAEEYDLQLQTYYQQRAAHQQQCVRLNQILYGLQPSSTSVQAGYPSFPPTAQPMAISPGPPPRSPLQAHTEFYTNNNNMQAAPHPSAISFMQKKKRSAQHDDGSSSWDMYDQSHKRLAKRHHQ